MASQAIFQAKVQLKMFILIELSPRVHNALAATKSDVNTLRTGLTSITNSLFNIKAEILDADSLQVGSFPVGHF